MGAIFFSLDPELAKLLRQKLQINVFFETGTFEAATALLMAPLFERLVTVEISSQLFDAAVKKLAQFSNAEVIHGSSPDVLRTRAAELKGKNVLYWLDAHWCNCDGTGGASEECPLLGELEAIGRLQENSVILIDDARYFLAPPPPPNNFVKWPDLLVVAKALMRASDKHKIFVINDVILFLPVSVVDDIAAYAHNRGVDLLALTRAAIQNRESASKGIAPLRQVSASGSTVHAEFNGALLQQERPERIFAFHAVRLRISRLLDIGSNTGQFASQMRRFGYHGFIYSVEPQAKAYIALKQGAQSDVRWIPLPRQAAGAGSSFCELNIAENNLSSSLLTVHENHLRAEPKARAIAQEQVFVTGTADLLRAPLMAQITAVKIAVQGYEARVLEGLRPCIDQVQLLLVEMSLAQCYVGASDLFGLDRTIVHDFGFKRVSLEPSYYDDTTGFVQKYDGIYIRETVDESILLPSVAAPTFGRIITSLHGQPSRFAPNGAEIGDKWAELCVNSWRRHTSRIVSVSEIAPVQSDVLWIEVSSRPSLAQIFDAFHDKLDSHTVLCNADIMLSDALAGIRHQLDPAAVYLAHRVEVELRPTDMQTLDFKTVYGLGYDLFILPPEFVQYVKQYRSKLTEFRIGEPWWDYLVPILALAGGFPVKRLPVNEAIALHYSHPTNYDHATWLRLGQKFLTAISQIDGFSNNGKTLLIEEILKLDGCLEEKLHETSKLICNSIP